ncbi:MAG: glutamate 5-kinase [Acidimicrobiales bacterium]
MLVVAKIGTSSITLPDGGVSAGAIAKLATDVSAARAAGYAVVLVTSGAVTAGVAALSPAGERPFDPVGLQAMAAIGQHRLMRQYDEALARHGMLAGQVLLAPLDFGHRQRYLHARKTLSRLLELGVVPVVNENDAIADDEIRFGDNDRLAALVAHLMQAEILVLLTDTSGLLSADPRLDDDATLIEEVARIDGAGEQLAGGPGSDSARGGMAAKLAAAKMATWSGVRTVIAAADRPGVLLDAVAGAPGVGTVFLPHARSLPARKLWIAFALKPKGRLLVDAGARRALVERGTSLLAAGVVAVEGGFGEEDAVELCGPDGVVFAKGIAGLPSSRSGEWIGRRTQDLPDELRYEVIHRDDLVLLVDS